MNDTNQEWNPDPFWIEQLEKLIDSHTDQNARIAVGDRVLTWDDLLAEIRAGTEFGRNYYNSFLEGLQEE